MVTCIYIMGNKVYSVNCGDCQCCINVFDAILFFSPQVQENLSLQKQ